MKRIIYGGSFDPIHKGHILAAESALKEVNADLVYFVPCFSSPDAKKFKADYEDRVNMINLAIKGNSKFECSLIESKIEGISYTYKTLEAFKQQYPNDEFYILIGCDQYQNLDSWKEINKLKSNANFIIVNRDNIQINKKDDSDIIINKFDVHCSSHELILNPSLEFMDQAVIDYINENGIYWLERLKDNRISEYRLGHSIAVADYAKKIGLANNRKDLTTLWVAGIYHDIAKDFSKEETIAFVEKYLPNIKEYPSWKVLHPYVGAYILEHKYLFTNKDILSGIYNHTIVEEPTQFNKIIYCADKLVPRIDDVPSERLILDKIMVKCLQNIDIGYEELADYMKKSHE